VNASNALRNIPGVAGAEDNPALQAVLGVSALGVVKTVLPALFKAGAPVAGTRCEWPGQRCGSAISGAASEAGELIGMGSKVLRPIGAVLGIGMAVKNMYDIIDATRKGEAYDPSHVRGQGINVNMGDVVHQGGQSGEQVWESVKGQFISA
jgi:hypothetical protein